MNQSHRIYLDFHATTPCDPRVVDEMLPFLSQFFGNPSSLQTASGQIAADAVQDARCAVAELVGASAHEVVFTSGATESNNLAILGLAPAASVHRGRIVTTMIEHKSVLSPVRELGRRGFDVQFAPVDGQGRVDLDVLKSMLSDNTYVVSVQAANNEIGTVQEIQAISELVHRYGALFHCDAVQAIGRISVDVDLWNVDLMSISAHKIYGPKGAGALYVRGGPKALPIQPLVFGGGQEEGLRPGTLNVPAIVGFGAAARLCREAWAEEAIRIGALRDQLEQGLARSIDSIRFNGHLAHRLPGNSSITFFGVEAEALLVRCPDLELSTGSACTSGAPEPSYVLLAAGMSREEAYQTLRVGLGRFTTPAQVASAIEHITETVAEMIPLSRLHVAGTGH